METRTNGKQNNSSRHTRILPFFVFAAPCPPEQISWLALPWLSRNSCLKCIYIAFYRLEVCEIEFEKGDKKLFLKKARAHRAIYEFFTIRLKGIKACI